MYQASLSKQEKKTLRSDLFRHLDGIAVAPTAYALYQNKVLDYLLEHKSAKVSDLCTQFNTNSGYLNVALRILCSQGWLEQKLDPQGGDPIYSCNDKSAYAFSLVTYYREVVHLMQFGEHFHKRKFEVQPFRVLKSIFKEFQNNYGLLKNPEDESKHSIELQVLKHIEGVMVGPTIVSLGMSGMFHKYFMHASFSADEFHQDVESFGALLDMLSFMGWFDKQGNTYKFTPKGLFFARRATAYGVTVSYIPTFRKVEQLIFGNPLLLWDAASDGSEQHVDRRMNVWGSGGAHSTYFKKIDEIIIEIFNRPIEEQPKGIVDMGCGNGAFLQHLYEIIERNTLRGEMLEEYPLFLVGADYNEAALKVTRANLIKADIWAKVIKGDIGRPDLLAKDLKENYNIELEELLNVRTFLDHNRIWEETATTDEASRSTGAYASRGERISNPLVEKNLYNHLLKWSPYVQKFGLLMIELHTIPPHVTRENLGKTAATAYDATHGFSDQYIVELDVFISVAEKAGLFADQRYFNKFPNSELATVSIGLYKAKS